MYCTLHSSLDKCVLYTTQLTRLVCTVYYTLYTVYCTLHTEHCILCTASCTIKRAGFNKIFEESSVSFALFSVFPIYRYESYRLCCVFLEAIWSATHAPIWVQNHIFLNEKNNGLLKKTKDFSKLHILLIETR